MKLIREYDELGSPDPVRMAFVDGFNEAREMIIAALKETDAYGWDEDLIRSVGTQEVNIPYGCHSK